ncbi:hypothetical protein E3N88_46248 [Mikania micrantha]|uniref:Uncharacterized protein n=1 Tax=Mikania micrantha TaxID=192012 RepID=A0A5N6L737_9ASTR|nr:hypothetical protein E3N88_46248 [Mikania micrantha]
MGGSNGQNSKMDREKNLEKANAAAKGTYLPLFSFDRSNHRNNTPHHYPLSQFFAALTASLHVPAALQVDKEHVLSNTCGNSTLEMKTLGLALSHSIRRQPSTGIQWHNRINHGAPVEDVIYLPTGGLIATAGGNNVKKVEQDLHFMSCVGKCTGQCLS